MDEGIRAERPLGMRFLVLAGVAAVLVLALGVVSHLAHAATIPNVGLPVSNGKSLANVAAYDPQVTVTQEYLQDLARLNYAAAYQLVAPSARAGLSEAQFESQHRQEGVLGQATVWPDDTTSTRAEYVVGRADGSSDTRRHRFLLKSEQGRWWIDREVSLPTTLAPSPTLNAAMTDYVEQRAGRIWTASIELLRQEAFADGQLLLFSYIEPRPANVLMSERVAILTYYVDGRQGWQFQGGGNTGLTAGMGMADVAMGFTAFGPNQRYVAYYGVIENTNAVTLSFQEPNRGKHSEDVKGQRTVLFLNERNPYEQLPFSQPFVSLQVKDAAGNSLRTNPEVPTQAASG